MRFASYLLAATTLLAVPAIAQTPAKKCEATMEFASSGTWYAENGPRLGFDCKSDGKTLSGIYLPVGNDGNAANDLHIKASFTLGSLTPTIVFSKAEVTGYGGALILKQKLGKDASAVSRVTAYDSGLLLGELKFLSKHIDLTAGARKFNGKTNPFGYATYNFGKWDDTFTVGFDVNKKIWQNYTAERDTNGILEIFSYQPSSDNWLLDVYMGRDELARGWFTRDTDRLLANNDIVPKPRSFILAFPSYLAFGDKSGEIMAERYGNITYVNTGIGKRVKIGKAKIGLGGGVEYERNENETIWRPNGEVFIEFPLFGGTLSAQHRFRRNGGGFYANFGVPF